MLTIMELLSSFHASLLNYEKGKFTGRVVVDVPFTQGVMGRPRINQETAVFPPSKNDPGILFLKK
jgi:hypothetical protein